jgi:hypothetical protein
VGSRGTPGRAVRCEATAGHHVVEVRMVLELSPPGMEDAGKAGEVGAAEALLVREPFEGLRRGCAHGLGGEPLRRADKRAPGPRDGERHEQGRSGKLFVQMVL